MGVLGSALGCRSVAVLSCCTAAEAEVLALVDRADDSSPLNPGPDIGAIVAPRTPRGYQSGLIHHPDRSP